jgi:HTH-type transcriptional regulator/antitoxin MqsA
MSGKNPRYCLQCDDGTWLEHARKDITETIDGQVLHVPAVSGWHCPVCGECEFDPGEAKRYSDALDALRKRDNEARAREIRDIRKRLGLRQADAGRIFGGGAGAFSEYEHGKTQAHKSTVLLLRLLGRHPELMKEIM